MSVTGVWFGEGLGTNTSLQTLITNYKQFKSKVFIEHLINTEFVSVSILLSIFLQQGGAFQPRSGLQR